MNQSVAYFVSILSVFYDKNTIPHPLVSWYLVWGPSKKVCNFGAIGYTPLLAKNKRTQF